MPPLLLLGLAASPLAAQSRPAPPQRTWVSVGLGDADMGPLVMASGAYSYGPAVVIGRAASAGAIISGDAVNDKAILVGARTAGSSGFLLGAVGIGRTRHTLLHSDAGPDRDPPQRTFAFEVKVQGGGSFAQLGGGMVGAVGPHHANYIGVVGTANFGEFGASTTVRRLYYARPLRRRMSHSRPSRPANGTIHIPLRMGHQRSGLSSAFTWERIAASTASSVPTVPPVARANIAIVGPSGELER